MGVRRRSRELALQMLFQVEFSPRVAPSEIFQHFQHDFEVDSEVVDYASQVVEGIAANLAEIDAKIQECSAHWKIARMALVDLNVMRIATFEMKFLELGPKMAINEAVDIAKKYGTTDSGAFVNGILDQISKKI